MLTGKLFKNGRSQAVRLPKECNFKGTEVGIVKIGETVTLYPKEKAFEIMKSSLGKFTPDFMAERRQPKKVDRRKKL